MNKISYECLVMCSTRTGGYIDECLSSKIKFREF